MKNNFPKIIRKINIFILKYYFFSSLLILSIISFYGINILMSGSLGFGFLLISINDLESSVNFKGIIFILGFFIISIISLIYFLLQFFRKKEYKIFDYIIYITMLLYKYIFILNFIYSIFRFDLVFIMVFMIYDIYKTYIYIKYKKNGKLYKLISEGKFIKIFYFLTFGLFFLLFLFSGGKPDNLVKVDDSIFDNVDKKLILDKSKNGSIYIHDNIDVLENKYFKDNIGDIEDIRHCFLYNNKYEKHKYGTYKAYRFNNKLSLRKLGKTIF